MLIGEPSISQLLEKKFHESGLSKVRVYNFGVVASVLRMDIARFLYEASDYNPDLVVFYGGGNDIGLPFQADPRPGYPPNFLAYENNPLILAGTGEQSWGTLLKLALFHSRTVRAIGGEGLRRSLVPLDKVRSKVGWNTPQWSKAVGDGILSDITRAAKLCRGFRVGCLFALQPILEFKLNPAAEELQLKDASIGAHAKIVRELILQGLPSVQQQAPIDFVDLSFIFDSTPLAVFWDGIHVYQEYQTVVADGVYEAIRKLEIFKN